MDERSAGSSARARRPTPPSSGCTAELLGRSKNEIMRERALRPVGCEGPAAALLGRGAGTEASPAGAEPVIGGGRR